MDHNYGGFVDNSKKGGIFICHHGAHGVLMVRLRGTQLAAGSSKRCYSASALATVANKERFF